MRTGWLTIALALGAAGSCFPELPPETPGTKGAAEPRTEVLWHPKSVAEIYEVGELRAFEFRQADKLIGRSWGRYDGPVKLGDRSLHRFSTRIELLPEGTEPLRSAAEVLVDDTGHLVSGFERSPAAELRYEVVDELLTMTAHTGMPQTQKEELKFDAQTAFMGYMATIHEELMLATRQLTTGKNGWRLISLSTGRADEWSATAQAQGTVVEVETSLGEHIEFVAGKITRVEIRDDQLVVRGVDSEWPTWEVQAPRILRYEPPAHRSFEISEVELPGRVGDPALAGEVLRPTGAGSNPLPAVLFLAAGPVTRHGFAGPPAVDLGSHEITDALAEAGFVVLRYDERGTGDSEPAEFSWEGQLEDARRAFRTLIVQDGVDPDRVVVVGHGEGGWRALQMGVERPKSVTGVALLGSDGRSFRERFKDQPQTLRSLETGSGLPAGLAAQKKWFQEILRYDPAKVLANVGVPLWFAQGGKDFEVDPKEAIKSLTRHARKHRKNYKVARFPELDHLFKPVVGDSGPTNYLEDRIVDPAFIEALVDWARSRTRRDPP